ncbi:unnamed protein product [Pocillopora meandrina]|uniref:Uncharacterized protein n=1 Tax=Pocillopora meandrina TaxID=46732 RepID=A0AAU9W542_9CNID|nr:unnamed protein product [Pocillopora meandrina]
MKTSTMISTLCFFFILSSFFQFSDAFVSNQVGRRSSKHERNLQDICRLAYEQCGALGPEQQSRDSTVEDARLKRRDIEFFY